MRLPEAITDIPPLKGVVFVELVAMAEAHLGEEAVDRILDMDGLQDGGAYTTVERYSCRELAMLVERISRETGLEMSGLQTAFGRWIYRRFNESHPEFFASKSCGFELLESVDREIHTEVRKIYPDTMTPRIHAERRGPDTLVVVYESPRGLISFCRGMIEETFVDFGETVEIAQSDLPDSDFGTRARFEITRRQSDG